MLSDVLLSPCSICEQSSLAQVEKGYICDYCGLFVKHKKPFLGFGSKDNYIVQEISDEYSLVKSGLVGHTFSLAELKNFRESVYSNQTLVRFASGEFEELLMPASTLSQILLEQLRETCYLEINNLRRAHGPVLEAGGNRFPQGTILASNLTWQDKGNLFLTNVRLVFPSNTFTFIRMDRRLIGLKTFENGIAIQRKGEDFATYFVGCRIYQAALLAAYIQGKVPALRQTLAETP